MLSDVLSKLSHNTDAIVELLEFYGCARIKVNAKEIRFSRDDKPGSGPNISIRLGNEACLVKDYSRNVCNNIVSYLCNEKHVEFRDVLKEIKRILKLDDYWQPPSKVRSLFGGCYENIIHKREYLTRTYPEEILNPYLPIGNTLWMKDGISLETQRKFDICFDVESNSIIFPWRNDKDEIIAVKARINGDPPEGVSKYWYPIGGNISSSLYGYSQNYPYLYGNDVVIVEAEKSCLQGYTFNYRNIVALGSNNLSEAQAKLILQLQPKRIIMALDEGLEFEQIAKNMDLLKSLATMRDIDILYWDSTMDIDIPLKASPTDMGKEKFEEIMQEQLVEYKS